MSKNWAAHSTLCKIHLTETGPKIQGNKWREKKLWINIWSFYRNYQAQNYHNEPMMYSKKVILQNSEAARSTKLNKATKQNNVALGIKKTDQRQNSSSSERVHQKTNGVQAGLKSTEDLIHWYLIELLKHRIRSDQFLLTIAETDGHTIMLAWIGAIIDTQKQLFTSKTGENYTGFWATELDAKETQPTNKAKLRQWSSVFTWMIENNQEHQLTRV